MGKNFGMDHTRTLDSFNSTHGQKGESCQRRTQLSYVIKEGEFLTYRKEY